MNDWGRELRTAFRALVKDYRSTGPAVATLAVGIGGATALFSVFYGVLLRPLPYPSPDRIVQVSQIFESGNKGQFSDPNFEDLRERNRSFAFFAQYASWIDSVTAAGEPVRARIATVSREFFDVLGVDPFLGRAFAEDELREGGSPAALVSHAFWQRHFGASPDLSDRTLSGSGRIHAVVGVMPPGFRFPPETDLWIPRELEPRRPSRTAHNWRALARLKEGVSVEAARADVSAIASELRALYGDDTWMVDATAVPLHEELVGRVRPALLVLLGAVLFLLLVATANVVNLLLARAAARGREVAVKAALGASRWDLVRSALTESGLLAATGGALGVLLARFGVPLLLALEPGKLPRTGEIGVSLPVLLFSLLVAVVVSLGIGLATALRSASANMGELKDRSSAGRSSSARLRKGLVVAQVALTLVLLVGSGLLARSLFQLLQVDAGFRRTRALVVDMTHSGSGAAEEKGELGRVQQEILSRLRSLPGVQDAGLSDSLPLATGFRNGVFLVMTSPDEVIDFEGFERLAKDPSRVGEAEYRSATEGFFETMRIPLVRGRLFDGRDTRDAPHVALVSESLVREKWPSEDPIGKLIQFGNMDGDLRLLTVVGIVGDVRHGGLDAPPRPTLYTNARQRPPSGYSLVIGIDADAAAVAGPVRGILREAAPDVPPRLRVIEEVFSESVADRRFNAVLLGAFGIAALLLAVFGIYGVIAYGVSERTREIGLRMALGARPRDVIGQVLGQGSRLIAAGIVMGVALGLALTRLLSSLLFGVGANDPLTFAGLAVALGTIALAACYLPARQASRVDPMTSIRYE